MQILTANHWTEVKDLYGRVRGRIKGAEGDGNPIGRATVRTNPDPLELSETKPPTKEHAQAGLRFPQPYCTYVAQDCLVRPQWERMSLIL